MRNRLSSQKGISTRGIEVKIAAIISEWLGGIRTKYESALEKIAEMDRQADAILAKLNAVMTQEEIMFVFAVVDGLLDPSVLNMLPKPQLTNDLVRNINLTQKLRHELALIIESTAPEASDKCAEVLMENADLFGGDPPPFHIVFTNEKNSAGSFNIDDYNIQINLEFILQFFFDGRRTIFNNIESLIGHEIVHAIDHQQHANNFLQRNKFKEYAPDYDKMDPERLPYFYYNRNTEIYGFLHMMQNDLSSVGEEELKSYRDSHGDWEKFVSEHSSTYEGIKRYLYKENKIKILKMLWNYFFDK
jgi:hypothetical protein